MTDIPSEISEIYATLDPIPVDEVDLISDTVPPEATEAVIDEHVADERHRGPDGKFAAKESAEASNEWVEEAESKDEAGAEEDAKKVEDETKDEEKPVAPSNMPKALREAWADLPEPVRAAFKASQDEMSGKLGQAERIAQGLGPIRDAMTAVAEKIPHMMNMRPAQIADEITQLSVWAQKLQTDPAGTLAGIAQHYGAGEALASKLGGTAAPETAALTQQIAQLQRQIAQMSDPTSINEIVSQRVNEASAAASVNAEVQHFANSKTDWADVEPYVPQFVGLVRQMTPNASNQQVLEEAYDMAKHAIPSLRASSEAAKTANAATQQRAEAAKHATAINVKPNGAGKPAPQSDRAAMQEIWNRHH